MIDLHCHIIPDFDDGARDLEEAVYLCAMAYENGIQKLVATPHRKDLSDIDSFIRERDKKLTQLREELFHREINVDVYSGVELFVGDDIFFAPDLSKFTINNSKYILIEFSFHSISLKRMVRYIDEIMERGFVPIIAHPERYDCIQRDYAIAGFVVDRGALLQVNADSLAGFAGKEDFRLAYELVSKNAVSFIATDAHSPYTRPNDLMNLIAAFPKDISAETLDYMLNIAPETVLKNGDLPERPRGTILKRTFFSFL